MTYLLITLAQMGVGVVLFFATFGIVALIDNGEVNAREESWKR